LGRAARGARPLTLTRLPSGHDDAARGGVEPFDDLAWQPGDETRQVEADGRRRGWRRYDVGRDHEVRPHVADDARRYVCDERAVRDAVRAPKQGGEDRRQTARHAHAPPDGGVWQGHELVRTEVGTDGVERNLGRPEARGITPDRAGSP